ncbi:hypothetical protein F5X99DRAFT_396622 [Biscogniauxia marginata]|nr:hypothetical protein F5X99DRAFT_396622 [Biscogniauxia marginata]
MHEIAYAEPDPEEAKENLRDAAILFFMRDAILNAGMTMVLAVVSTRPENIPYGFICGYSFTHSIIFLLFLIAVFALRIRIYWIEHGHSRFKSSRLFPYAENTSVRLRFISQHLKTLAADGARKLGSIRRRIPRVQPATTRFSLVSSPGYQEELKGYDGSCHGLDASSAIPSFEPFPNAHLYDPVEGDHPSRSSMMSMPKAKSYQPNHGRDEINLPLLGSDEELSEVDLGDSRRVSDCSDETLPVGILSGGGSSHSVVHQERKELRHYAQYSTADVYRDQSVRVITNNARPLPAPYYTSRLTRAAGHAERSLGSSPSERISEDDGDDEMSASWF